MIAPRAFVLLAGALAGAAGLSLGAAPATAQVDGSGNAPVDQSVVLNILLQCARIDDPTARLACYDNNIRSAGGQARSSVPGRMGAPSGGGGIAPSGGSGASPVGGFGADDVRAPTPQRAEAPAPRNPGADSLTAQVARVEPREPGFYLLTLADGAQWRFAEGVERSFRVPRPGDAIVIERASLGSYLMRFNGQVGVRIQRVR